MPDGGINGETEEFEWWEANGDIDGYEEVIEDGDRDLLVAPDGGTNIIVANFLYFE